MDTRLTQALYRLAMDRACTIHYKTVDISPESFQTLKASTLETLPILGKYSENSIYGLPEGNVAFRAWHDTIHLALNADFSFAEHAGEYRVAVEQCRQASLYSATLADVLWADTYGQGQHMLKHGAFPANQLGFVEYYLKNHNADIQF